MVLEVAGLGKTFDRTPALTGVSFGVDEGELVSIIGPSGSGKTTLLRIIAGIESPSEGRVSFSKQPSRQNPVLIVFQDYVLFPHMTVYENVAFGLRARRRTYEKTEIADRVDRMLTFFGISELATSYPAHISGGQRQRTAIARAMIVDPYVLLLDEPFANLDQNLKLETAEFIRKTQKSFGTATICVTHDLEEAFVMSDRLGVLLGGELHQLAAPEEVYFAPATLEAANFLGPVNVIPRSIFDLIKIPPEQSQNARIYSRAEGLSLTRSSNGCGVVTGVRFRGLGTIYDVDVRGVELQVHSLDTGFAVGTRVALRLERFFTTQQRG